MQTIPIKYLFKLMLLCALFVLQSYAQAEIKVTYYIPDASGSPVAATDEQGKVLWRKHYKPFGEEIEQGNASRNNHIGYTGHVHDKSTGLTYMGARYYDPIVGRFMAMDPAGVNPNDPRTFNRYVYANNNPYKFVDPDGRLSMLIEGIGVGLIGFGILTAVNPEKSKEMTAPLLQGWKSFNQDGNVDNDLVDGVLDGAEPGDKTKGRTTNWDKPGGMDQANNDFDKLVPSGAKPIDDSGDGDNGRKGVMEDGRKVNVRPNSSDGRPTLEIQNGKNKTKVRYND